MQMIAFAIDRQAIEPLAVSHKQKQTGVVILRSACRPIAFRLGDATKDLNRCVLAPNLLVFALVSVCVLADGPSTERRKPRIVAYYKPVCGHPSHGVAASGIVARLGGWDPSSRPPARFALGGQTLLRMTTAEFCFWLAAYR
jgi:hypothetical protein